MPTTLTYEAYRQCRRFPALDGLRAIAILGVLLHHTRNSPFPRLHGYRGVWVFFVLSGFLITTLALREEARRGRLDLRAFWIRRVFRIMPLYYLTLAVFVLWAGVWGLEGHADAFRHALPSYVLYVSEFPIFRSNFQIPFGQSWSLGIEEKFYLLWPLIAFAILARSRYRLLATLVLLATTGIFTITSHGLAQMWGSYTDILLGCLLAQGLDKRVSYRVLAVLGQPAWAWGLWALLAVLTVRPGTGTQFGECLYALTAALALAAVVTGEEGPTAPLRTPWLLRIGAWSYAIYLTHPLALDVVGRALPKGRLGDWLSLPATLLIVLPVCAGLHVYFEKPLIQLGRRLAERRPSIGAASNSIDASAVQPP